jgi:hypothetical protein
MKSEMRNKLLNEIQRIELLIESISSTLCFVNVDDLWKRIECYSFLIEDQYS